MISEKTVKIENKLNTTTINSQKGSTIDESTRFTNLKVTPLTSDVPTFTRTFPPLSANEVNNYKSQLLFAILSKKMEYTEELVPIDCSLDDDTEESLDFGIAHMNRTEVKAY